MVDTKMLAPDSTLKKKENQDSYADSAVKKYEYKIMHAKYLMHGRLEMGTQTVPQPFLKTFIPIFKIPMTSRKRHMNDI